MDIKYYKEQSHNYLVIHKCAIDQAILFQQKMLSQKKMDYLLDTTVRNIDGEEYDYYDISSKISFGQLFGSRNININDLRNLLGDMKEACLEIDKYLLDPNRIIINPNFIFYSYSKERYIFLYNISTDLEDSIFGLGEFMDFLLDKVNNSDPEATDYIYKMYEIFETGNADIWNMIELFPWENEKEDACVADNSIELSDSSLPIYGDQPLVAELSKPVPEDLEWQESEYKEKRLNAGIALICIGIVGNIICGCIYAFLQLTDSEQMLLLAGGITSLVVMLAGISLLVYRQLQKHRNKKQDEELQEYISDELSALSFEKIKSVRADSMMRMPSMSSRELQTKAVMPEKEYGDESQTVFFDSDLQTASYKLYALDKNNKQHISLDKFPCIIGKMSDYVDCCLDHPTISRLHAQIDMKDNRLIISDLNSTNGVFLNGIRLNPNEARDIDAGDEIRLGGLNYCLRLSGC